MAGRLLVHFYEQVHALGRGHVRVHECILIWECVCVCAEAVNASELQSIFNLFVLRVCVLSSPFAISGWMSVKLGLHQTHEQFCAE